MLKKNDTNLLNPEFKLEFNDVFAEKNINQLQHHFDKHGVN
jgi:hypothetical protein